MMPATIYAYGQCYVQAAPPVTYLAVRGLNANVKLDLALANKILAGTATAPEILELVGKRVGVWWYRIKGKNSPYVEDAADFAVHEDDLTMGIGKYNYEEELKPGKVKRISVELPVVLLAKSPSGWNPDDNPDSVLMGNSYINRHKWPTVELLEVRYLYRRGQGRGWVKGDWAIKDARGIKVQL